MSAPYDLAVIGGGIMGCGVALRAAEAGMRTVVLEQSEIGSGASSVNAGTLSLQIKRVKLMPYALKGYALWQAAGAVAVFPGARILKDSQARSTPYAKGASDPPTTIKDALPPRIAWKASPMATVDEAQATEYVKQLPARPSLIAMWAAAALFIAITTARGVNSR